MTEKGGEEEEVREREGEEKGGLKWMVLVISERLAGAREVQRD